MQQLIVDVTGQPYPRFMKEKVLAPLGMESSTFDQPLDDAWAVRAATGHTFNRKKVKGRWHIYPEMAAAGLWTTASDLAHFAIGIQQSLAGKANPVISVEMAHRMLTDMDNNYGLGIGVDRAFGKLRFSHGGRDEGFDAMLMAYDSGDGAVIMINTNDNSRMVTRILEFIAREYQWRGYPLPALTARPSATVSAGFLDACAGRYEVSNNNMRTFVARDGKLFKMVDGLIDEELVPAGGSQFFYEGSDRQVTFVKNKDGEIVGYDWQEGGRKGRAPRIGPLVHSLKRGPDPDPARTARVEAVLKTLGQGGEAVRTVRGLTPGARRNLAGGIAPLAGLKSIEFVAVEDVAGRGIERHEAKVSRILYGKVVIDTTPSYILVHLTAADEVTDFDLVDD